MSDTQHSYLFILQSNDEALKGVRIGVISKRPFDEVAASKGLLLVSALIQPKDSKDTIEEFVQNPTARLVVGLFGQQQQHDVNAMATEAKKEEEEPSEQKRHKTEK